MGYFLTILITVSFSRMSVLHGVSKDISKLEFLAADALVGRAWYANIRNFEFIWIRVSQFEIYPEFA
jgi:uncharacterized membrane protein YiaA